MSVEKIKEEIKQLELRIKVLKIQAGKIQQACNHQFSGNEYFETCTKCSKVNVLYY
ncbi:Uncharacterised protein [Bacillus freudenreichii]|nr:Uncharacterised protein [Bacillus freudenreichii]